MILTDKPWLAAPEGEVPEVIVSAAPGRIALRFFLAVIGVMFFLFTITYISRSQYPDFQALAGEPWLPFNDASVLWRNTGILLIASIAMQSALVWSKQGQRIRVVLALIIAVVTTLGFMLAQLSVWNQLSLNGYLVQSNPANSYFYLLTAIHALHLLGGFFVLVHCIWRLNAGQAVESCSEKLSLCATYWHFLLALWLFLFALLTASPDTYQAIAAFCGL